MPSASSSSSNCKFIHSQVPIRFYFLSDHRAFLPPTFPSQAVSSPKESVRSQSNCKSKITNCHRFRDKSHHRTESSQQSPNSTFKVTSPESSQQPTVMVITDVKEHSTGTSLRKLRTKPKESRHRHNQQSTVLHPTLHSLSLNNRPIYSNCVDIFVICPTRAAAGAGTQTCST